MKDNGITGDPAIARDLGLCSAQTRCLFRPPIIDHRGHTETSVSLSPLTAITLGGELLDGAGEMLTQLRWAPRLRQQPSGRADAPRASSIRRCGDWGGSGRSVVSSLWCGRRRIQKFLQVGLGAMAWPARGFACQRPGECRVDGQRLGRGRRRQPGSERGEEPTGIGFAEDFDKVPHALVEMLG